MIKKFETYIKESKNNEVVPLDIRKEFDGNFEDGKYKGKALTNDTYSYLLYYYDTLGKDYKRLGTVTIIR